MVSYTAVYTNNSVEDNIKCFRFISLDLNNFISLFQRKICNSKNFYQFVLQANISRLHIGNAVHIDTIFISQLGIGKI